MINSYPNPWDFSNIDKNLVSPDGQFKIEYGELNEIAMGAPIGGACYLITPTERLKLNDWCGGPILWDNLGKKIVLPIWTETREQQIGIIDIEIKSMTVYSKIFRVLYLTTFNENIISGYDSPIHKTVDVKFDIRSEKTEKVIELK